jgi:hypothetical protein
MSEQIQARPIYLPYEAGPHRPSMGLQSLDLAEWIEIDRHFADELAGKQHLLASRHEEVFASLPEALAASQEALDLLVDHLPQRFPTIFKRSGRALTNILTGESWNLSSPDLHPLDLAGRLIQEDLCLMQRREEGWCLTAASLCAPSRWSLAEKMGRPLAEIHAPVPLYAEKLARPVDRFFDKLTVAKPVFRVNWSIKDDPTLFQPLRYTAPSGPPITLETAGTKVYLRTERQTLRRFPVSDAILFTIRTHVHPLEDCILTKEEAITLASAIEGLPPELANYKNIGRFAEVLGRWLTQRANGR